MALNIPLFFKKSFGKSLRIAFAIAMSILLAIALLSYNSLQRLINNSRQVEHTNLVLSKLEEIISVVKEVESSQRSFVLKNDAAFLMPYYNAHKNVQDSFTAIDDLLKNNPVQQQRLDSLKKVINNRLDLIEKEIADHNAGLSENVALILEGKLVMDQVRRLVNEMKDEELALLREGSRATQRYAKVTPALVILFSLAAFFTALLAYLRMHSDYKLLQATKEELSGSKEELQQAQNHLQGLLDTSPNGVVLFKAIRNKWGKITDFELMLLNPSAQKMTGLGQESIGKHMSVLFPDNMQPGRFEMYKEVVDTGLVLNLEYYSEIYEKWFYVIGVKYEDGLTATFTNITDRKRAELELVSKHKELQLTMAELNKAKERLTILNRELERRVQERTRALELAHQEANLERNKLKTLFMQAPALLSITRGEDFVYELANNLYLQTMGCTESIEGKTINEVLPGLEPAVLQVLKSVLYTGQRYIGNDFPITLDWDHKQVAYTKYFNLVFEPVTTADGAIDGLLTLGYEVTEHVMARRQIKESSERFLLVLESIPHMAFTALPGGEHTFYNKQWYNYTGKAEEELISKGWLAAVNSDDRPFVTSSWESSLSEGTPLELECRLEGVDRASHWHLIKAVPICSEKGEVTLWVGTCTNIHDQKLAKEELGIKNEELLKINADLDNFIYRASHDLKSPISNIEGLTSVLYRKLDGRVDATEKTMLELISASVGKFKKTIQELTDIAKVQKGLSDEAEQVSFEAVLQDVKEEVAGLILKTGAVVEDNLQVQHIHYPRHDLRSIVYNLLSNAVKYSSPERLPVVIVRTLQDEEYTVLQISDNGLGLTKVQQSKLFEMFKRLHSHVEGTGIGLYIVKRIVENKGGYIKVESQPGQGTTFKVYLKPVPVLLKPVEINLMGDDVVLND